MSSTKHPDATNPSPMLPHFLAVCERYKSAWQAAASGGPVPRIDDFLADTPPEDRPTLRAELKLLDSWVRDLLPVWGIPVSRLSDTIHPTLPTTVQRPPGEPVSSREYDFSVTADHTPASLDTADFASAASIPTLTMSGEVGGAARVPVGVPGYELLGQLGQGGMGVVYKARQVKANRLVALKLMLRADYASPAALARFEIEAQAVARMQHPNIVQVFEVGDAGGVPFFSLEFVDGGTLADLGRTELLPSRRAAELVETMARAVHYAHTQQIVHRDLKPANILLTHDGVPKVADFGLAKRIEDEDDGLTRDGAVMGTPSYMSPEQAFGRQHEIGPRSDVYALGAILYDLIAGRPPFKGSTSFETLEQVRTREPVPPTQLRPDTPRDLETISLKCLQKEPGKRYATAEELADDLRRYLNNEPIQARPVSAMEKAYRWCKRNRAVASLLATAFTLLLALAVGAGVYAWQMDAKNTVITQEKGKLATQVEQYREVAQKISVDIPAMMDQAQLGTATREEFLRYVAEVLADADRNENDQGITRRGIQATRNTEGDLALARRDFDLAQKKYEEAKAISEEQLKDPRGEADRIRGNLAVAFLKLALVEKSRPKGDPATVKRLYGQALDLQREVLAKPATGAIPPDEARIWIANTLTELAEFARTRGELAEGRKHSQEALKLVEAIAPANLSPKQQEQYRLKAAAAWLEDGRLAFKLGDDAGGHAGFTNAIAHHDAAVASNKTSARLRLMATIPPAEYGDHQLVRFNDPKKAQELFDKSLSYLRPVLVTPEGSRLQRRLALDYYRMAMAYRKIKDEAKTKLYFERAWAILEGAFHGVNEEYERNQARQKATTDKAEQTRLQDEGNAIAAEQNAIRINLMVYRARTGRVDGPAGSLDIADRARAAYPRIGPMHRQYRDFAGFLMQAAITYGLCAELNPAKKPELLDKAFECLREAIVRGYNDPEFLKSDPDLDSLRGDPRFAEAVK